MLSKNIPYGCLLGIHTLFDLRIGFKVGKEGYQPYFNEEEIGSMDSSLLLEDLNRNKVSFVLIEDGNISNLEQLPE